MPAIIEIGGSGAFVFSAAHTGLHGEEFETLHGHTFVVTVRLYGELDPSGMLVDFSVVKKALAEAVDPLRRRTLMPRHLRRGQSWYANGQVIVDCGTKRYSLPAPDVALLPIANTTTEAIAAHLLDQLLPHLQDEPGLTRVDLILAEAPDTAASVTADVGACR